MIDIIPNKKSQLPAWNNIVLSLGVVLLLASTLGFLGLLRINAETKNTIDAIDLQLSQEKTNDEIALENKVFLSRDKLNDFQKIAKERKYPIEFFKFLETSVHENIYFRALVLEPVEDKVFLEGVAITFKDLAEQVLILKSEESISSVSLSSIEFDSTGEVIFGMNIIFNKDFFETSTEIVIETEL